ncbi:GNAT family N-acetyltransferase [Ningiella sp. W23]|uniref:GNAT family N-acetyltransferase n=1 Tax=Ningiella sp. W23 TaxID=3023715 RepID=UPI0037579A5F
MQLTAPHAQFEQSYRDYIQELGDEERYPYPMDLPFDDFAVFVSTLKGYDKGIKLPHNLVPNSTYWLISNNEIVGCSHLRHHLNAALEHAGGHIGLGIRPRYRNKGLSTILLRQTLDKAREKGIDDVHIHCYADNLASKRMIEACGAKLHSQVFLSEHSKTVLRYIKLNPG